MGMQEDEVSRPVSRGLPQVCVPVGGQRKGEGEAAIEMAEYLGRYESTRGLISSVRVRLKA